MFVGAYVKSKESLTTKQIQVHKQFELGFSETVKNNY